ncbi:hypothetical protein NC651_024282 [Populus alba x Populus x berolinensis]|nr:hypothetical protein NC651_024282 [Populus alba x Populus x berolinensis]
MAISMDVVFLTINLPPKLWRKASEKTLAKLGSAQKVQEILHISVASVFGFD